MFRFSFGIITFTELDIDSVQTEITDNNSDKGTNAYRFN
jgi:hypothetical protein